MNEIKSAYLAILQQYVDEQLHITDNAAELKKEMERNYWWIGGSPEQIASLSFQEWREYMRRLVENRQAQLDNSKVDTDLIFYCYHDHQAGQLRFNIISSAHSELPFSCKTEEVEMDIVLKDFLQDEFFGVIPNEGLVPISMDEAERHERELPEFIAKIYVQKIAKRK